MDLHRLMAMAPPIAPGALALATSNPTITGAWTLIVNEGDVVMTLGPVDPTEDLSQPVPPRASGRSSRGGCAAT